MMTRESTWGSRAADARPIAWTLVALGALWFVLVLVAGRRGVFVAGPSRPPLPVLAAVIGPPAAFAVAYGMSRRFRDFALAIDPRLLTAIQMWRVLGGVFLVLYAFGLLPALFAWPAGLGDMAVGVAALFVLRAMLVNASGWPRRVRWLNLAGLTDFAAAVGTGVLTSNSTLGLLADPTPWADLGALPLSLIPTFAVPLWIVAHMIALLQLRRPRGHAPA